MKTRTFIKSATLSVLSASSLALVAQVTATGVAEVTIIKPINIKPTGSLSFGKIVLMEGGGGSLTVDAESRIAKAGNVASAGGDRKAGQFTLNGGSRAAFTVQLDTDVELTHAGDRTKKLNVRINQLKFGHEPADDLPAGGGKAFVSRNVQLGGDGKLDLKVGGTLEVPNGTIDGKFEGKYEITVIHP